MYYFDNLIVMSRQHNLQIESHCFYPYLTISLIWLFKQVVEFFNH